MRSTSIRRTPFSIGSEVLRIGRKGDVKMAVARLSSGRSRHLLDGSGPQRVSQEWRRAVTATVTEGQTLSVTQIEKQGQHEIGSGWKRSTATWPPPDGSPWTRSSRRRPAPFGRRDSRNARGCGREHRQRHEFPLYVRRQERLRVDDPLANGERRETSRELTTTRRSIPSTLGCCERPRARNVRTIEGSAAGNRLAHSLMTVRTMIRPRRSMARESLGPAGRWAFMGRAGPNKETSCLSLACWMVAFLAVAADSRDAPSPASLSQYWSAGGKAVNVELRQSTGMGDHPRVLPGSLNWKTMRGRARLRRPTRGESSDMGNDSASASISYCDQFLYVLVRNADGSAEILLPKETEDTPRVARDATILLPPDNTAFHFTPPAGKEHLRVIASPIELPEAAVAPVVRAAERTAFWARVRRRSDSPTQVASLAQAAKDIAAGKLARGCEVVAAEPSSEGNRVLIASSEGGCNALLVCDIVLKTREVTRGMLPDESVRLPMLRGLRCPRQYS